MYVRDTCGDTPLGISFREGNPLKSLSREEIEVLHYTEAAKDELAVSPGIGRCRCLVQT